MPIEIKHALMTWEALPDVTRPLPDYEIEIVYENNRAVKVYIHDKKRGVTIARIQEKPV